MFSYLGIYLLCRLFSSLSSQFPCNRFVREPSFSLVPSISSLLLISFFSPLVFPPSFSLSLSLFLIITLRACATSAGERY